MADLSQDAEDSLLRTGLDQATQAKQALKDALQRVSPLQRVPKPGTPGSRLRTTSVAAGNSATAQDAPAEDVIKDLNCDVHFNPNTGLTRMLCSASIKRTQRELAMILDPRSWSCLGDVIGAAYLVTQDAHGQYAAALLPETGGAAVAAASVDEKFKSLELGQPWKKPQLLYEYAHSEVASFENILRIKKFSVSNSEIEATYQLYDCLTCTFGFLSAPGGLTVNEGYVTAERQTGSANKGWWLIKVKKVVQVRDLTPQDPGNKYDFGEWVNSTIGGALSQWVREAATALSPLL